MWLVLSESIDNGDWVRETAEPYNTGRVQVRGKDTMYTWYCYISRHLTRLHYRASTLWLFSSEFLLNPDYPRRGIEVDQI